MALIAYFKFNNDTVDTIGTYSSNTPTSITYTNLGKLDSAAIFNGSSSSLLLGSTINLAGNANWTVSVWIKTTSNARMSILSNSSGGPVVNDICIEGGKITYYHYNSSWLVKQGTKTVNDGRWHNLVWVNFTGNRMNMYVDGILDRAMVDSTQSTGPVNQIGKNWGTGYFNGTMDELKIYNDSSIGKIQDLSFTRKMLGHWPLNGNANNVLFTGALSTINSGGYTNGGKIGQALNIVSGSGSTTITPSNFNINLNHSAWSFSLWGKPNKSLWDSTTDRFTFFEMGSYYIANETSITIQRHNGSSAKNNIYMVLYTNQVQTYAGNLAFTDSELNDWIYICVTFDGNNKLEMHTWGKDSGYRRITSTNGWNKETALIRDNIFLGGYGWATSDWKSLINDSKFYNYVLSDYQIIEASKAKILHYTFDDQYEEPTINLVPGSNGVNSYPSFGNTHGTYNVNQYNNNNYFSIGTIDNITNNIVTLASVGTVINTYDVLNPQTTGGGVTGGTSYFIKKINSTQFTIHAYNNSQDGSQGYINPSTGNYKVYDSIANDERVTISLSGFPTMWKGNAHLPNSSLVKEIIPNAIGTETETFHGHSFIRLHTGHKTGTVGDYMAYGVLPTVVSGLTYTFSFWYRAADVDSIGATFNHTCYTGAGWAASSGTLVAELGWKKAVWTGAAPNSGGTNMYWGGQVNGRTIDISEIQVEQKTAATPFTIGTRNGNVIDISGYRYNGTLSSIAQSPKWVTNSKVGSGSIYFGGTTPHIITGITSFTGLTNVTISFWRKNDTTITHWLPFVGQTGDYYIMATSSGTGGFYNANIGSSWEIFKDGIGQGVAVAATPFTDQEWHHYVIRGVNLSTWTQFRINGYTGVWNNEGYFDDIRIYNTNLSDINIKTIYERRGNLDNLSNVQTGEFDLSNSYFSPLIDYSTWVVGNTSATGWARNGSSSENIILVKENPVNQSDIMWATLTNDVASDEDGGFDSSYGYIDRTKKYRYSIWIKRENIGNGRTYFGCGANTVSSLGSGETSQSNPYFVTYLNSDKPNLGTQWVLIVAHIHPEGYTGATDTVSGFYDTRGNKISSIATDYKWLSSSMTTMIRAYMYYSTSTSERQFFYRPRIDLIDGNEPTLEDLITCSDNPTLYGKTVANMNKKMLFNANSQGIFRDIDEVSKTKNYLAQHEITNTGTLIINGEFSEVD